MKQACSVWVSHFLQAEEMEHYHSVCLENLAQISQNPDFFSHVNTVDQSWIHQYDPKCESEAWLCSGESRMKKNCQQKSADKVMLVAFFDCQGMIYQHVCSPITLVRSITRWYWKDSLIIPDRNDQNFFNGDFIINTMLGRIGLLLC